MKKELKQAIPMAEAFCRLLFPFAEVVIHDLKKDRIEAIYNPFSKRKVGDDSYLDRVDFSVDSEENFIGPYEKLNYDGRKLKSISVVIQDDKGDAIGFLCVNMDVSVFDTLGQFLTNFDPTLSKQKQSLFKDDLYEQINQFIQEHCRSNKVCLESLTRQEKQELVQLLKRQGALNGKNATQYISRILKISRATVYNYLQEEF